ncbi:hypothetical protein [Cytobacillus sp. FSL R5-0596]|uniref:hypothetical protein n=1 Tax=Cytobacillus sp. FSL R5-0596 TaxID=2954696 RepID=UPI0030FC82EA
MDSFKIGTWFSYQKPRWEIKLDGCEENVIEKTGLSRERLIKVLKVLHDNEIID